MLFQIQPHLGNKPFHFFYTPLGAAGGQWIATIIGVKPS
jgi:hypothetical protein